MKTILSLLAAFLGVAAASSAAVLSWNSSYAEAASIPDGAPTGWSETHHFEGEGSSVANVSVHFNVSGGYNGDLYVYLAHDGQIAVLLNRVGRSSGNSFGYGDAGMNVTFRDQAVFGDIHAYQQASGSTILGGAEWQPDGRLTDPMFANFTDNRSKLLSGFTGMDASGAWTLFAADLSGGATSQIESWGLEMETVSAVPEPAPTALLIFGAIALSNEARRRLCKRNQSRS